MTRRKISPLKPKSLNNLSSTTTSKMVKKYTLKRSLEMSETEAKLVQQSSNKKVKLEELLKENQDQDDLLADYEILRLANIARRTSKFEELNLTEIKNQLILKTEKKSSISRRGLSSTNAGEKISILPSRKSLRLQKIDADTGLTLPEKEPTLYFVDQTPQRPPLTDLDMGELVQEDEKDQAFKYFNEQIKPSLLKSESNCNKSIFDDVKNLGKNLCKLKITPETVAKVVPSRIFSLAVHPTESKVLVAAGSKWGDIGFWDVQDTKSQIHGVQTFKHHSRPVNCLSFNISDPSQLISTSYDGSVRLFDLNQQKSSVIFGFPEDETFSYTSYHSQLDTHTFLITLGRHGMVGLVDTRVSNRLKTVADFKIYDKASPKMVDIHPTKRHLFVTPSNKGQCGIYDLRQGTCNKIMAPITSLLGHSRALSSAFFSRITGNKVVTVCYDNKLRLFDTTSQLGKDLKPYKSIAHNNQTGRWLTTFKAEWHPRKDNIFFVGSMSQPRQMDVFTDTGDHHFNLKGDDLASICSIVKCHPTRDIVVGGNSSGRVHVFM